MECTKFETQDDRILAAIEYENAFHKIIDCFHEKLRAVVGLFTNTYNYYKSCIDGNENLINDYNVCVLRNNNNLSENGTINANNIGSINKF